MSSNTSCHIPFEYKDTTFNYCYKGVGFTNFQCLVNNVLETCRLGRFLSVTSAPDLNFDASLAKHLVLSDPGTYKLTYFIFLFSPRFNDYASDNDDIVQVTMNNELIDDIQLNQTTNQNRWTQRTVEFDLADSDNFKTSLVVRFSRQTPSKQITYFALDNLQVNYLGMRPPVTTPDPQTTSKITPDLTSEITTSVTPETITDQTPSIITKFTSKATDWILGIFLPAILISIIIMIVLFWKRTGEILTRLDTRRNESVNVKYSRDRSRVSYNDQDDGECILSGMEAGLKIDDEKW